MDGASSVVPNQLIEALNMMNQIRPVVIRRFGEKSSSRPLSDNLAQHH